jgi:hypothetical protein
VWRAVPDGLVALQPHEKTNPIRSTPVHQVLSERRFFVSAASDKEERDKAVALKEFLEQRKP